MANLKISKKKVVNYRTNYPTLHKSLRIVEHPAYLEPSETKHVNRLGWAERIRVYHGKSKHREDAHS
jgi:hypothetical protein